MSTFEKLMTKLEATPVNERGDVLHRAAVQRLAEWSAEGVAKTVAELRALGHNGIAAAFENAAWEASFERHQVA